MSSMVLIALALATADVSPTLSWPQFRGPQGDGLVEKISHPLKWSDTQNVAWKVPAPGTGWSSPVVAGGKVFLTAASGEKIEKPKDMTRGSADPRSMPFAAVTKPPNITLVYQLACLDLDTGKTLWTKQVEQTQPKTAIHPSNSFATETPVVDGDNVCAFYGTSGALVCFNHAGEKKWEKRYPVYPTAVGFGPGSSLCLHGGKLFLQRDNEQQSQLAAIDPSTGKEIWSVPHNSKTSWSTPFLWRSSKRTDLVICGSTSVTGYDPETGKEIWRFGSVTTSFSASPSASRDLLFAGNGGPFSVSPLFAIRAGATGDISLPQGKKSSDVVPWYRTGSGPGLSSMIYLEGLVYVPGQGMIKVYDAATGEPVYRERIKTAKIFVASPWSADGKIFLLDEAGQCFVLKQGRKFEVLDVNKLDDTFWSTPAVVGPSLVLRGVESIYCVRAANSVNAN